MRNGSFRAPDQTQAHKLLQSVDRNVIERQRDAAHDQFTPDHGPLHIDSSHAPAPALAHISTDAHYCAHGRKSGGNLISIKKSREWLPSRAVQM